VILLFSFLGIFWESIIAFSLVFVHELVHSYAAHKLGYDILRIEIFPFGGVAEYLGLVAMEPLNEIKIAIVGPLFNLITAVVFFIFTN
jgi:stage IV sporulation protein FB